MTDIRLAGLQDLNTLVQLDKLHAGDELGSCATYGLTGQTFSTAQFQELIQHHWVVVATNNQQIIGYVIAAKWAFFNGVGIYRKMLNQLAKQGITSKNSCQYGPVWIEKKCRSTGVFSLLIDFLAKQVSTEFSTMVTFIAESNEVSFAAHTAKANMEVIDYFEFERRDFYLLKKWIC